MMGGKMMPGKMLRIGGDDDDDDSDDSDVNFNNDSSDSDSDSESDNAEEEDKKADGDKKPAAAAAAAAAKDDKKSANLSSSDDDDEEEEEEEDAAKPAAKRPRDEEEEDDDEDDSDEDEDDDGVKKNDKNKKKRPKISFFDEEAEASDDDDDDARKHKTEEDIRREYQDEEAEALMAQQDRRRQRDRTWFESIGRMTDDKEKDDADVARIARELEERHRTERRIVNRGRGVVGQGKRRGVIADEEEMDIVEGPAYTAVSQQSLVPSVSDPSLFMFSCPTGKEQDLVYQIMNKCVAYAKQGRPLGITSVVAAQTKGKIYVESYNEPSVIEAVQGVRGLMQYTMRKVPISDMTTVMTVVPKKVPCEYKSVLAFWVFQTNCD